MAIELLSPDGMRVERRDVEAPVALLSLDTETDYGCGRTEALDQLDRFTDLMAELGVPWTAFVEGRFFESRPALCRALDARGVDVQIHVHDHGTPGDTPDSLRRSAAAYADCLGRRPAGYRAHTYRLTRPLYDTLREEGFRWDSSLMRGFAQGGNRHPGFRGGDYLVLDDALVEFPIGTWKGVPIPLNHTHLLLAKTPGELALRALFGPPRLVVYNFHMTDLVRSGSLAFATRGRAVRMLHRYLWSTHGADTFAVVRRFVHYLARQGYGFRTTDAMHRLVAGGAAAPEGRSDRP
jgi:hypothetical protein